MEGKIRDESFVGLSITISIQRKYPSPFLLIPSPLEKSDPLPTPHRNGSCEWTQGASGTRYVKYVIMNEFCI